MPSSDYYLPRASHAPQLGAGAIADYRERGWTVSPGGLVGTGQVGGPCGRCRRPCWRYGKCGRSLCPACERGSTRRSERR